MANEELYTSDRQDGSGYGPQSTIPPPANCTVFVSIRRFSLFLYKNQRNFVAAPVSETHKPEVSSVEENLENDDCQVSGQEIREFLLPMVEPYFRKDEDLVVLESMNTDPPKNYYANEVNRNIINPRITDL